MKRNFKIGAVFLLAAAAGAKVSVAEAAATAQAVAPLRTYAGHWSVVRQGAPKPDDLKNECSLIGNYFACQQTVNGEVSGLLLLIPSGTTGRYHTQNVLPNGRATGLGELQIDGNKWVFLSTWNQGAKSIRYRTTNTFSGRDRIHFQQEESEDGRTWKTTGSGDDTRVK